MSRSWLQRFEKARDARRRARVRCPWRVTEGCCHSTCRLTGEDCDGCRSSPVSAILPTVNESMADILGTIQTIREGTAGPVQFVVVDDCSSPRLELPPGTLQEGDVFLRNDDRLGCTTSRRRALAYATGKFVSLPDAHMGWGPGNLRKLCHLARKHAGLAYAGCNKHTACNLMLLDGVLEAKWNGSPYKGQEGPVRTTCMMGASYTIERARLLDAGGWVALPGFAGSQEMNQALNLQRQGIPIICALDLAASNWHQFRDAPCAPVPFAGYQLNLCLAHRTFWSDETWRERWKPALLARKFVSHNKAKTPWRMRPEVVDLAEEWAPWPGATPESDASFLAALQLGPTDLPDSTAQVACSGCGGSGWIGREACSDCRGTGYAYVTVAAGETR